LSQAAAGAEFEGIRRRLTELSLSDEAIASVVGRVSHGPRDQDEFIALRDRVMPAGDTSGQFEQYALLRTALPRIELIAALPVPGGVKSFLEDELHWLSQPQTRERRWLVAGTYEFSALCKLVTFRRFPAGQMHWEVGGLARSALWRVGWRELPRLLRGIIRLGGFAPALSPHLAWRRRQIVLSEREHYRSLALMAQVLELQPALRGFVAEAWFYSPDTVAASPHLAWAPQLFRDWDGVLLVTGAAGKESGVFESGKGRQELAASGAFRPTLGLAIWPRSAMLRWAAHYARSAPA
jgi:hypothetical protein